MVGSVDSPHATRMYRAALGATTITLCRLHAGPAQLTERVMLRGQGLGPGWGMPGDELKGQPAARLRHIADQATADAEVLDRASLGDLRVDTGGRSVQDIAQEILRDTGWPDRKAKP